MSYDTSENVLTVIDTIGILHAMRAITKSDINNIFKLQQPKVKNLTKGCACNFLKRANLLALEIKH